MSSLSAVLWDMDGTLVDTEPYWIAAEFRLVAAWGGVWTQHHAHALIGNPLLVSAEYIREHGGVDLPPPEIVDLLLADVIRDCERAVPWRPGARELLAELAAARIPCALVTMSYAELARAVVTQLPAGTFATLVTGDELEHGKPHPEAYLTAASRLGVLPANTVAIEDSLPGVASAEAAGCVVLSVPSHVPIPLAPTRTVRDTLVGIDVPWLTALVAP
jgi:HAD superfamily hydrolase (TIGR01509 family)